MISWITGELVSSWQTNNKFFILINCQGLGYEIQIIEPLFNFYKKIDISTTPIVLWLKHIKKEDYDLLFGFSSKEERDFFIEILNIKGIGSQIGMSLLNKFSINEIINAIAENDKKLISSVQGIGTKMTERIILELKNKSKINKNKSSNNEQSQHLKQNSEIKSILEDIETTLKSLNYTKMEIKDTLKILNEINIKKLKPSNEGPLEISFEELLKEAMNYLNNKNINIGL